MNFTEKIARRAQCSVEEKRDAIILISKIVELAEKTRREGILAVEEILDTVTNPLLIKGLELMIEGTDPKVLKEIFLKYIYFGGAKGKILLEQCIVCDGILAVQGGDNPHVIRERLVAFLGGMDYLGSEGFVFLSEVEKQLKEDEQRKISDYIEEIKDKQPRSDNTKILDGFIPDLNHKQILAILKEIDSNSLAIALSGASGKVITRIFATVSQEYKLFLKADLEKSVNCEGKEIIDHQTKILNIYNNLKEKGEI